MHVRALVFTVPGLIKVDFPLHYHFWSKKLNVHFGYFTWGKSLRLEPMLSATNDLVARSLQIPSNQFKILDLGCGFGTTALQILAQFPNVNLTGVNLLASQIGLAKQRPGQASLQFLNADFKAIPLPNESFDAAYALEGACYSTDENKNKLIAEVARLLRSYSSFIVVDGFRKHDRKLPWLVDILYKKNLKAWEIPSLATIDGFCEALKFHGFDTVKTRDLSWNMLPSLLHIPFVIANLIFANFREKNAGRSWYIRALILTLALSPFKRHFGYFIVTSVKSSVKSQF